MKKNDCVILGGIVKHKNMRGGYGFKVTFLTAKEAVYYKDMFFYIIRSDKYKVIKENGYYDKKEE